MPPKPKCTPEQKQKILDKLANSVPIVTILKDMKNHVSAATIYRIRAEYQADKARADNLAETGQGESIEKAIDNKRQKMGPPWSCANKNYETQEGKHKFDRYEGENDKAFCSYKCYKEFKANTFFREYDEAEAYLRKKHNIPAPQYVYVDHWYTKKYQKDLVELSAVFFKDEIEADNG